MTATIDRPKDRCSRSCGYTLWHHDGHPDVNDVRRCEHGAVWRATGRQETGIYFNVLDVWTRVSRFWEPFTYRRAVRSLSAPELEGEDQ